jgi:hypothetical protein
MSDPRGVPSLPELEAILRACGTDLRYPSTPDVASRVPGLLADPAPSHPNGVPPAMFSAPPLPVPAAAEPAEAPRVGRRWPREWGKLAAAALAFALLGVLLVAVFRERDANLSYVADGVPAPTITTTSTAAASPTDEPPTSYLLRTEDDVRAWALSATFVADVEQTQIVSITPGTLWDKRNEDANAGVFDESTSDPDDTPMWRVEYAGPLKVFPLMCMATATDCRLPPRLVIWFRASDGSFDGVRGYDPATESPNVVVTPTVTATNFSPFGELPPDFLLRTEDDARAWAKSVSDGSGGGREVVSVEQLTRRDQIIADARGGSSYSRDAEDTPMWRVEYEGPPFPVPGDHCLRGSVPSCPSVVRTVIWFRASDGFYNGITGYDPATAAPAPTPAPTVAVTLPRDPAQPLFPDAEVVHIVATTTGRFVQGPEEVQGPLMTEYWLNRVTGDALVRVTRANGDLESLTLKRGPTQTSYLAEAYNGLTGAPLYTLLQQTALTADDPALRLTFPQLDWYRQALDSGHAVVIGEGERDGQPAVEVQSAPGTAAAHIAWLDRDTLLPLEVIVEGLDRPTGNDTFEQTTYSVIETLTAAELPADVFDVAFPSEDVTTMRVIDRQLSPADLTAFGAYALWSLGASFQDYALAHATQHLETGEGMPTTDQTTFVYTRGLGRNDRLTTICKPALSDGDVQALEASRGPTAEPTTIAGASAWIITPIYLNGLGVWVDLPRPDGFVTVEAPDRGTALAAAEQLTRANAP